MFWTIVGALFFFFYILPTLLEVLGLITLITLPAFIKVLLIPLTTTTAVVKKVFGFVKNKYHFLALYVLVMALILMQSTLSKMSFHEITNFLLVLIGILSALFVPIYLIKKVPKSQPYVISFILLCWIVLFYLFSKTN